VLCGRLSITDILVLETALTLRFFFLADRFINAFGARRHACRQVFRHALKAFEIVSSKSAVTIWYRTWGSFLVLVDIFLSAVAPFLEIRLAVFVAY